MKLVSLRFILKNGSEFTVKCAEYSFERHRITDQLLSYKLKGITENNPIFVDLSEVAAVIRLVQDEQEGGDEG